MPYPSASLSGHGHDVSAGENTKIFWFFSSEKNMACFCLVLLLLLAAPAPAGGPAMPFQVGINLDSVSDYAAESAFVDAVKQSRHWGTAATPWDEAVRDDLAPHPVNAA